MAMLISWLLACLEYHLYAIQTLSLLIGEKAANLEVS
jgi:hypothetical protein